MLINLYSHNFPPVDTYSPNIETYILLGSKEIRVFDADDENSHVRDITFWVVFSYSYIFASVAIVLFATVYHCYKIAHGGEVEVVFEHRNINLWHRDEGPLLERMFIGFSIIKTWEKLCDTRSKYNANALITIRGIKLLSILWIGHSVIWFSIYSLPRNGVEFLTETINEF